MVVTMRVIPQNLQYLYRPIFLSPMSLPPSPPLLSHPLPPPSTIPDLVSMTPLTSSPLSWEFPDLHRIYPMQTPRGRLINVRKIT
jgi:hypothetical protein